MSNNGEHSLELEQEELHFLKRNLPDFLTASRIVTGLVILCLSFAGKNAYMAVVILTLVGGATDILDGQLARRYFREGKEGRLGKHDIEIDTVFILCVLAYFTFSGVVINFAVGLGWIILASAAILLTKRDLRVIIATEVITVIALLVITFIYNPFVFGVVIAPVFAAGMIVNHRRLLYIMFKYWPTLFSRK
jgi:phosphatidylglycerophosphate synthase